MLGQEVHHKLASIYGDAASAGAIIGYFLGVLPHIAAVVGLVWYMLQIAESKYGQIFIGWLQKKFQPK
jgi:chromate transport protein ChrA